MVSIDCMLLLFSHCRVWFFVTPWTVAHQIPLPMGLPGKNTGMGCPFLLQGIFTTQGKFFTTEPQEKPINCIGWLL